MGKLKFNSQEEYAAARDAYIESHPEFREAEEIECLSLIMKKQYALQILRGEKPLEYRNFSKFYCSRLIDKGISEFIQEHIDDDEVMMFYNDIRQVKTIHFHDYNNSWFLDIECDFNDAFCVNKRDLDFLAKQYGVHDFDDDLAILEVEKIEDRPYLFYFVMGKVIDTNLKV